MDVGMAEARLQRPVIRLDHIDVEELTAKTDGWVAALQLASLSLRDRDDPVELIETMTGRHHVISEFLAENVLDTLEPSILDFLLATSITEKPRSVTCFTASLRNSSVYCLLLPINTSMVAMNYGARASTKGWPVQNSALIKRVAVWLSAAVAAVALTRILSL